MLLRQPVVLAGVGVRLEPLSMVHLSQLVQAGADSAIWTWYPFTVAGEPGMRAFVETAIRDQQRGDALPFAIIDSASNLAIGSSRFAAIERSHERAEIGWTWLAPAYWRTGVNTETKLLMLQYAFEQQGLMRVEFKTDSLNTQSRQALAAIGAQQEGIFRHHMLTHTGRVRDSVHFSILATEWPTVKLRLQAKLARRGAGVP